MKFKDLNLISPILKAVDLQGYVVPTPIQEQAIPIVLAGRDIIGCAQTGTGKTAAFAIPILQLLYNEKEQAPRLQPQHQSRGRVPVKVLIMTPTRELAVQIGESFTDYGKFTGIRHTVIFGGVSQGAQTSSLKAGPDILIATPGRLLDLIGQGFIQLNSVQLFVLDEADRMLDMGFIHDMKKVIAMLPSKRQTLLFSATMPHEITALANSILIQPVKVEVTPPASTVDLIDQTIYLVEKKDKKYLLQELLEKESIESALIFTKTKHGADKVVKDLASVNILAQAIHGNKSQAARQLALNNFKQKLTKVLVATDIAARGIDVPELSHVINYELPNIPETYVHRIGRTGRAGLGGTAISFCDIEEREFLRDIQKLISKKITVIEDHPFRSTLTEEDLKAMKAAQPKVQNRPQRQAPGSRQPQDRGIRSSRSNDGPRQSTQRDNISNPSSSMQRNPISNPYQNPQRDSVSNPRQGARPSQQAGQPSRTRQPGSRPFSRDIGSYNDKRSENQ